MIGRLLRTGAGLSPPDSTTYAFESVQEEAHTRALLYPEPGALRAHVAPAAALQNPWPPLTTKAANAPDDAGGVDLAYPADLRTLVAQDANARHGQPQVLFDSDAGKASAARPASPASPALDAGDPLYARRGLDRTGSLTSPDGLASPRQRTPNLAGVARAQTSPSSPTSPDSRFRSIFGSGRPRQAAAPERSAHDPAASGKLHRDAKEKTDALLACMFGAPGFRLEPGVKLHVLPANFFDDGAPSSRGHERVRPFSSGGHVRQPTPLMRSTSAVDMSSSSSAHGVPGARQHSKRRTYVTITRLFTVDLSERARAESQAGWQPPPMQLHPRETDTGPSPSEPPESAARGPKQTKTPMFAVAVVLRLPAESQTQHLRSRGSHATLSTTASSFSDQGSWTLGGHDHGAYAGVAGEHPNIVGANSQLSLVLKHWKLVEKLLGTLESEAKAQLIDILEESLKATPTIVQSPSPLTKTKSAKPANQQSVFAIPGCLQRNPQIIRTASVCGQQLVSSLRVRRVVAGQERWGIWGNEAQWISKWCSSHERPNILDTLLSAFLGSHLDWMQSTSIGHHWPGTSDIGPHFKTRALSPSRTVIVASNKMVARRLVFLVAQFLAGSSMPSYQHLNLLHHEVCPHIANSLPNGSFDLEQVLDKSPARSLRRPKSAPRRTPGHGRSVSFSTLEPTDDGASVGSQAIPGSVARRDSDARSLVASSLPVQRPSEGTRKASLSTIPAESSIPVPYFAAPLPHRPASRSERGSVGTVHSAASEALTHNLRRSESSTGSAIRWGSLMGGLWNAKKAPSVDDSDAIASSPESLPARRLEDRRPSGAGNLARMVEEASWAQPPTGPSAKQLSHSPTSRGKLQEAPAERLGADAESVTLEAPPSPKIDRVPLSVSFNEDDGFIDVALKPHASLGSSLASSVASVLHSHRFGSLGEHSTPPSSISSGILRSYAGTAPDVAGWLPAFNPDFVVQAVCPNDSLLTEIKAAMSAEARHDARHGLAAGQVTGEWSEYSACIVADVAKNLVQRLSLRQRRAVSLGTAAVTESAPDPALDRQTDSLEQDFVVETVAQGDPTLGEALDAILGHSGPSSQAHSVSSSPRHSTRPSTRARAEARRDPLAGERPAGASLEPGAETHHHHGECQRALFGALEEIVDSVSGELGAAAEGRHGGPDSVLRQGVRRALGAGGALPS